MTDNNETQTEATVPQTMQINIRMQQGEHTGQPLYSNFTSVQGGQGVVIVDFGFLDPQAIHALSQMARSGDKPSGTMSARMSCRMAISIDAANQLAQQLNQLLNKKTTAQTPIDQKKMADPVNRTASNTAPANEKNSVPENRQSGFKFPWSKKTH